MKLYLRADGETGTGKTFMLDRIIRFCELYGFEQIKKGEDAVNGGELVILDRSEDHINFIVGEKMIQLGDWIIELDSANKLVAVYHEGKDVFADEVEVSFATGQLTTIKAMSLINKDSDVLERE